MEPNPYLIFTAELKACTGSIFNCVELGEPASEELEDFLDAYAPLKFDREIQPLRQGPSPKEFELYHNV